ncbi:MAG: hypothetical protein WCY34_01745 [Candidatus Omnitrophota bacterium]|jgi:hypothetical protein
MKDRRVNSQGDRRKVLKKAKKTGQDRRKNKKDRRKWNVLDLDN